MTEMVNVVISVRDTRVEAEMPAELLTQGNMEQIVGNMRENNLPIPTQPVLTKTETGFSITEKPSFG